MITPNFVWPGRQLTGYGDWFWRNENRLTGGITPMETSVKMSKERYSDDKRP
jgi:hypothetical protein